MTETSTQSQTKDLHFEWEQDVYATINMIDNSDIDGQKSMHFNFHLNVETPPIILSHKDEHSFDIQNDEFEKETNVQSVMSTTPLIEEKCEQTVENEDDKFGQFFLISGKKNKNKPISDLTSHQQIDEDYDENDLIQHFGNPMIDEHGYFSDTDVVIEEGIVEINNSNQKVEKVPKKSKRKKEKKRSKHMKEKQKQTNKPKRDSAKILTTEIVNQSNTTEHTKEKKRTFSRHTKDEIVRLFFCSVQGCEHGYGTSSALRIHMQRKHPFLKPNNAPLSSSFSSTLTPSTNNTNTESVVCTPKSDQIEILFGDIAGEILFAHTLQEAVGIVTKSAELIPIPEGTPISAQLNPTQRMHRIIEQACCFCGFLEGQGRFQEFAFPLHCFSIGGGKWKMDSSHPKDIILILSPYLLTLTIETKINRSVYRFVLSMADILDWRMMSENDSVVTFSVTYGKKPEFHRYSENDKNKHKGFRNCEDFTEGIASNFARHEYAFEQSFSNFFNEVFFACRAQNY